MQFWSATIDYLVECAPCTKAVSLQQHPSFDFNPEHFVACHPHFLSPSCLSPAALSDTGKKPKQENRCSFDESFLCPLQLNPLASQVAAAAAMGSIAGSQVFGNTLSNLQGATGQLVTNAQGQVSAVCWEIKNFLNDQLYIKLTKYCREKTVSSVTDL